MKVKEIMTQNVIAASIKDDIYTLAKKMKKYNIGFLPIYNNEKIIGILTDRDIGVEILANKNLKNIESYIKRNIITISKDDDVKEAIQKMKEFKIKRLLVTDNKKVVGILSVSDLIECEDLKNDIYSMIQTIFKKEILLKEKCAEIDSFYL